jgi:Protein of unknown function (DUF1493)
MAGWSSLAGSVVETHAGEDALRSSARRQVEGATAPTFEEVAAFVREETGFCGPLTEATSLQWDIGLSGDDVDTFLTAYAKRFGVDLSGYLWYFHTEDEGLNLGELFFPPPNVRVREIPITVGMLHAFAQLSRWAVEYPQHKLPQSRWDIRLNQLLVLGALCFLVLVTVRGCVS